MLALARTAFAALILSTTCVVCAHAGTVSSCRSKLSPQDARQIAIQLPNARAFVQGQHARLTTALAGGDQGDSVHVRVVATAPDAAPVEVGVYTVSLRTGSVLDDDQEPADDETTRKEEARLLARDCRH